ncbi:MAG: flagellar motor protein MotA [Verrucomicrobia bacterium GWF2_51_19]|nr:MAG: flagellar motor protein MotA [Verrucomicrobia bacterium GWF2_51_19]HCJ12049.1 flagellar motor protein MotA [Opitutae bacterium]
MLLFIGYVIVLGSILGGFMIAGGNPILLMHVSEFVVIGGVSIGVLIIASPKDVLNNVIRDIKEGFSGVSETKDAFIDLLKLLYEMFMLSRRNGLIALDEHVGSPKDSAIFTRYPTFLKEKEHVDFLVNALRPLIDGKIKPEQLHGVLEEQLDAMEEEAGAGIGVMNLVGDSLPGIGIVAAVLGIINTMSAIAEGPEKVGEKVAAALTGTFLGVLGAYGFVNPLASRVKFNHRMKFMYYKVMLVSISGFAKGLAPLMAVEVARRSLDKAIQPEASELEEMMKSLGKKQ